MSRGRQTAVLGLPGRPHGCASGTGLASFGVALSERSKSDVELMGGWVDCGCRMGNRATKGRRAIPARTSPKSKLSQYESS